MARAFFYVVCVFIAALVRSDDSGGTLKLGRPHSSVSVGRFHFYLNDERLPTQQEIDANQTLIENIVDLALDTYDYYLGIPADTPIREEETAINGLAKDWLGYLGSSFQNYSQMINYTTFLYMNESLLDPNHELASQGYVLDYAFYYVQAAIDQAEQVWEYWQSGYMGVGWNVSCASQINDVLENKAEWEKTGSAAATTLMALIPTILAFGNLYVPRSSEAFATSLLVGCSSALYSLGLPVKSISAVKSSNILNLAYFGIKSLAEIERFGTSSEKLKRPAPEDVDSDVDTDDDEDEARTVSEDQTLEELRGWSRGGVGKLDKREFYKIRKAVGEWRKRWHLWHAPAVLICAGQMVCFALAIFPLLRGYGIPIYMLSCTVNWTGYYLVAIAGANMGFRFIMWETGYHERVKVYALSKSAVSSLNDLVNSHSGRPLRHTGEKDHFPPIYPPLLFRIKHYWHYMFPVLFGLNKSQHAEWQRVQHMLKTEKQMTILESIKLEASKYWVRTKHIAKNPLTVFKAGISGHKRNSARRWRPIVILIHLSTAGRNVFYTLGTGFVEAILYGLLTFFFAAQWGGNLVITGYAILLLIIFITIGRASSLAYVWWTSKVWGLRIINCENDEQILGSMRILCSMENRLTRVNGTYYYNGYRLDDHDHFKGWLLRYESGEYDANELPPKAPTPGVARKPTADVNISLTALPSMEPMSTGPTRRSTSSAHASSSSTTEPIPLQDMTQPSQTGAQASATTPADDNAPSRRPTLARTGTDQVASRPLVQSVSSMAKINTTSEAVTPGVGTEQPQSPNERV